jgi:hypothetical protein
MQFLCFLGFLCVVTCVVAVSPTATSVLLASRVYVCVCVCVCVCARAHAHPSRLLCAL